MTLAEKLARYSKRDPVTGCRIWTCTKWKTGYARFEWGDRIQPVVNIVWREAYDVTPPCICHKCDHKDCVEVEHLFDGTAYLNRVDYFIKQRAGLLVPRQRPDPLLTAARIEMSDRLLERIGDVDSGLWSQPRWEFACWREIYQPLLYELASKETVR